MQTAHQNHAEKADLDGMVNEVTRTARQARKSALKLGKSTMRDARSIATKHPQLVAAIGGGLIALSVVGLISRFRD